MTGARTRGVIIPLPPQTCGNLAIVERDTYAGQAQARTRATAERYRQRQRRVQAARRQRIAATIAVLLVAGLLAAFMPWRGADKPAQQVTDKLNTVEEVSTAAPVIATMSGTASAEYIPDAAEVEALAKMLYGEARGIASDTEKAACVWVVLNRVDDPRFPDTVLEVVEAPYQFAGYSPDYPATEELKALAADVLTRYHAERDGEENVGRVLPAEYCFFTGDGEHNYFTIGWQDTDTWGWTLESPYEN